MAKVLFSLVFVSISLKAAEHKVVAEKTFTYCSEVSPTNFNPQLASDGATFTASAQTIYNRLVAFDKSNTKVIPSLVRSWKVSNDGRVITFYLREDVSFHSTDYFKPTRNFNADDVVFTFNRMKDQNHPYHKVGGGDYPQFADLEMGQLIEKIEKTGPFTVRFQLKRPEAPFFANLAMDFASILSAEYGEKLLAEKKAEQIDRLPIGTGPFVFVWYEKDKTIRYRAHPNYFLGRSQVSQLVFTITPKPQLRLERLIHNECQLMGEPLASQINEIINNPELKLLQQQGLNISYLTMAANKPPFDDINVRRAVHYALNRPSYIKVVFGGHAQVAKNPIPPLMWSYNRSVQDLDYSLTKAKEYLKKSAYPDGFKTELWHTDVSRPYNPNPQKMAELIQKDLAQLGIEVKLRHWGWQEYLEQIRKGDPPMSLDGWSGDNGDPDNFFNNLLACFKPSGAGVRDQWCNKEFAFLIDRARVTTDIQKRTDFYARAQKIFKEQIPWVTIAHSVEFKVARKNVKDFKLSPFGYIDFHKVDLQ